MFQWYDPIDRGEGEYFNRTSFAAAHARGTISETTCIRVAYLVSRSCISTEEARLKFTSTLTPKWGFQDFNQYMFFLI